MLLLLLLLSCCLILTHLDTTVTAALRRQQDGGFFKSPHYPGYPFLMIPDLSNPYLSNSPLSPSARTVSFVLHLHTLWSCVAAVFFFWCVAIIFFFFAQSAAKVMRYFLKLQTSIPPPPPPVCEGAISTNSFCSFSEISPRSPLTFCFFFIHRSIHSHYFHYSPAMVFLSNPRELSLLFCSLRIFSPWQTFWL